MNFCIHLMLSWVIILMWGQKGNETSLLNLSSERTVSNVVGLLDPAQCWRNFGIISNKLFAFVHSWTKMLCVCVCVLTSGYAKQCTHTLSYRSSGSYLRWHRSPISLAPSAVLSRVFSRVPTKPDIVGPTTPRHRWLACSQPRYLAPPGPRRRWEAHGSMIGLGVPRFL